MNMPENSGIRLYLSIVCAFLCIGYLMSGITNNHEPNYRGEMPIEAENVNLDTVEMEPVINVENIDTEVVDVQEEFDTSSDLEKIGDVSYSEAIKVEGMTFNLYPTFENDVDAVYGIKSQAPKLIKGMQDKYCLSVCTPENIQDYIDHYYEYLEYAYEQANGIIDKTLAREMVSFESFIDIYENDECNDEIERIIDDLGMADLEENVNNIIGNDKPSNSAGIVKVDKSIKDETIEEETKENIIKEQLEDTVNVLNDLYVMMPSNTGAAEAVEAIEEEIIEDLELLSGVDETKNYVGMNSVKRISYNKNSKFSISKGVSYATKHATSPNVKKYSACVRGDCTNFTSQIKHEGGVPKYLKYGQKGAWNYKVVSATTYPKLNYTPRWCGADKFCKFYGIKSKWKTGAYSNKRTAFIKFAAAIKKGSFIAFDETNDGSWNHCGFVTAANSSATISYHGSKYKNFKVAQHTTNYYRWVSDSKCNWETKPYDGCPKVVYAIIN